MQSGIRHCSLLIALVCSLFETCMADFNCVCNYHVELAVHQQDDKTSSLFGYMYEFDCKPEAPSIKTSIGWLAVMFEHNLGFVESDSNVMVQICPGNIPALDMLPTSTTVATQTYVRTSKATTPTTHATTLSTTQTILPKTTIIPTTTASTTTTQKTTQTTNSPTTSPTTTTSTTTPTTAQTTTQTTNPITTTPVTHTTPTATSPRITTPTTIPTTTPATIPTIPTTIQTTTFPATTIPTTSPTTTSPTTTTKTTPTIDPTTTLITTTSSKSPTQTTHTITPSTTLITAPTTTSTTTKKNAVTTTHYSPASVELSAIQNKDVQHHENLNLCPNSTFPHMTHSSVLGYCYEFVVGLPRWFDLAEPYCQTHKGHLLTFGSLLEKEYIHDILEQNFTSIEFWISNAATSGAAWGEGSNIGHLIINQNSTIQGGCNVLVAKQTDLILSKTDCSSVHYFICKYNGGQRTSAPAELGRTEACPEGARDSLESRIDLVQHAYSCYELMQGSYNWSFANRTCHHNGGHILQINNEEEMAYMKTYLQRFEHEDVKGVWGINQLINNNPMYHCGILKLQLDGHWNWDRNFHQTQCGSSWNLGNGQIADERNTVICEYDLLKTTPFQEANVHFQMGNNPHLIG